jgi:hypothetical protein
MAIFSLTQDSVNKMLDYYKKKSSFAVLQNFFLCNFGGLGRIFKIVYNLIHLLVISLRISTIQGVSP